MSSISPPPPIFPSCFGVCAGVMKEGEGGCLLIGGLLVWTGHLILALPHNVGMCNFKIRFPRWVLSLAMIIKVYTVGPFVSRSESLCLSWQLFALLSWLRGESSSSGSRPKSLRATTSRSCSATGDSQTSNQVGVNTL